MIIGVRLLVRSGNTGVNMLTNIALREGSKCVPVMTGIYACEHFNFDMEFTDEHLRPSELNYPDFQDFNCYGVCDSAEQLMSCLPNEVINGETAYVISITQINKADEPEQHGWRWHKWGPYIGVHEPQCEYIADEPEIETVYCYHIYKVK